MKIAFVLLTYNGNEPAGIERAVATLSAALRRLGHDVMIMAAGPTSDDDTPDVLRLSTVTLPRPMLFDDVPRALGDPRPVYEEIQAVLTEHRVDVVCWTDAVAGLGYLAPAPEGVKTVLMAHLVRGDDWMRQSLSHAPDAVLAVSSFLIEESAGVGDTSGWQVLPNPVPHHVAAPAVEIREHLRRTGPLRALARPDPIKGIAGLLRALPKEFERPVQIVLANAGIELWPGMQDDVRRECLQLADTHPQVEIRPALPWDEVQRFLGGAALALVPTTWPETFGNVAAEALSVGTPVVGFHLGNLPHLVGSAGCLTPLGPAAEVHHIGAITTRNAQPPGAEDGFGRLWKTATTLLADSDSYHHASRHAADQVTECEPTAVARRFLRCAGIGD